MDTQQPVIYGNTNPCKVHATLQMPIRSGKIPCELYRVFADPNQGASLLRARFASMSSSRTDTVRRGWTVLRPQFQDGRRATLQGLSRRSAGFRPEASPDLSGQAAVQVKATRRLGAKQGISPNIRCRHHIYRCSR